MTPETPPPPKEPRWKYPLQRPWPVDESTIPPPSDGRAIYAWEHMEPTDMFLVPCAPEERRKVASRISSAGRAWFAKNRPDLYVVVNRVLKGVRVVVFERPLEDGDE